MMVYIGFVILLVLFFVNDYYLLMRKRKRVEGSFVKLQTRFGVVEYLDWGSPDDETVLVSYGGGTGIDFIYSLDWLKDKGYRIIAVNRPGYYNLSVDATPSISEHADVYHSVIKHLGIESVHVFALSMGGLSGLYYAERYPVKSLVLWSAVTGPYKVNQASVESPLGRLVMSDKGKSLVSWLMVRSAVLFPKATIASFINAEAELTKEKIQTISREISKDKTQKRRMIQFVESMAPMNKIYPGMMDELLKSSDDDGVTWSSIEAPVLAIGSIVDKDVSIDHLNRVQEKLKATIIRVENAGHFIWWGDESDMVYEETLNFIERYSDGSN